MNALSEGFLMLTMFDGIIRLKPDSNVLTQDLWLLKLPAGKHSECSVCFALFLPSSQTGKQVYHKLQDKEIEMQQRLKEMISAAA